jgi:hypothetical protein
MGAKGYWSNPGGENLGLQIPAKIEDSYMKKNAL